MPKYDVHIYREMRIPYRGVEADSPEAAAEACRDRPSRDPVECDGQTFAAVVDEHDGRGQLVSRDFLFEEGKLRLAAPAMQEALEDALAAYERGDELDVRQIRDAIALADSGRIGRPALDHDAAGPKTPPPSSPGDGDSPDVTYKVWLEIERYDDRTGRGEDMDAPGSSLATFASYEHAWDYAERVTAFADKLFGKAPREAAWPVPTAADPLPSPGEATPQARPFDLVGSIIAYESGELDQDGTVKLFQHLVDTGMAWQLQGTIGRTARDMIEAGLIEPPQARPVPSVADILADPKAYLPEPDGGHGPEHGNGKGRKM